MKTVLTIGFWSLMLVGGLLLAPLAAFYIAWSGDNLDTAANAASGVEP